MIAEQYRKMLDAKSVIRQLSEKATKRAQIIGAENVFDYSLGNPSVPAPAEFKQALLDLIEKEDPMTRLQPDTRYPVCEDGDCGVLKLQI